MCLKIVCATIACARNRIVLELHVLEDCIVPENYINAYAGELHMSEQIQIKSQVSTDARITDKLSLLII